MDRTGDTAALFYLGAKKEIRQNFIDAFGGL
jgi:hypothetical protein